MVCSFGVHPDHSIPFQVHPYSVARSFGVHSDHSIPFQVHPYSMVCSFRVHPDRSIPFQVHPNSMARSFGVHLGALGCIKEHLDALVMMSNRFPACRPF